MSDSEAAFLTTQGAVSNFKKALKRKDAISDTTYLLINKKVKSTTSKVYVHMDKEILETADE